MDDRLNALVSALTKDMSDEEFVLSTLQAMIGAEIMVRQTGMGLNQTEFAKLLGVSQSTLSKWENGDANFTLSTLVSIAGKLGIKMQCPFVPTPPKVYSSGESNVISFPASYGWSAESYSQDEPYTVSISRELEEM